MGFWNRHKKTEQRVATNDLLPQHFGMFGASGYNDSGVTITESNALIVGTVWSCVSLIAQTVATLPVHVLNDDGEKQYDHPLYQLLAVQPNEFMTPSVFREALMMNALIYGGAWAAVERDGTGYPVGLYPLKSSDVKPIRRAGQLLFEVRIGSSLFTLSQYEVVNLLGWTTDGITPLSPVRSAAQSLGLAVAMERYAGKAFNNAGNIGGILQVPNLSTDSMKSLVQSWRASYGGLDNSFKTVVLPDPMKFIPTSMDPEKGQLNESRQAIIPTICSIWKVPPSMVGDLSKNSYASLEQQNMSFYQQTILPWLVKLEQAFSQVCFLERERGELQLTFNADALLRTTTAERYAAYQQGRQGGWLSINDVRAKENLPPVEGGDTYLVPLNMAPATGPTDPTKPTTEPASTPTPAATDTPKAVPVPSDEPADAGTNASTMLNGAQIASAIDVLDRLAQKTLVGFAAIELLVAVGIAREAAVEMVEKTLAAPMPKPDDTANRSLVESTAKRFIVKEQRAFQRAAKKHQGKPDELRAWAETFYRDHLPLVTDALSPTLQAAGVSQSPGEVAQRHCSAALQIVSDAINKQLPVDDVCDSLEDQAGDLADSIFRGK